MRALNTKFGNRCILDILLLRTRLAVLHFDLPLFVADIHSTDYINISMTQKLVTLCIVIAFTVLT